jgi:dolichol-phosphate mannosyltransferase
MKTSVIIPTYNERESIKKLIEEILKLKTRNIEIIVVDDFSPDGTWKVVKEIARKKKNVHLLLRKGKRGRGLAGKCGFKFALKHNADYIIEMDADFSHNPKDILKLLKKIKNFDIVLGSRAVKGGKEIERGIIRRAITKLANFYIRLLLRLDVKDCNSGFRCFKRKVLEEIDVNNIKSKGPAIIQEVLFKAHLKGFKIAEVPITFVNRKLGRSKLGIRQLIQGYLMVIKLKLSKQINYKQKHNL